MEVKHENIRDYKDMAKKLSSVDYWKPLAGEHKVKFLTEPEPTEYTDTEGNVTPQERFDVEVAGKKYTWTIPIGKTRKSLYGQLMLWAATKGHFTGLSVTLLVKGEGIRKDYTVVEALNL